MEKALIILLALICLTEATNTSFVDRVCKLPKDVGVSCGAASKKVYYFDSFEERCMSFQYAGCKGNENKFNTSDECVDSCQMAYLLRKNKSEPDPDWDIKKYRKKSDCSLSPERGPCKALITMWFYNSKEKACMVFGYGGCNGNYNRFDSERECKMYCMSNQLNQTHSSNISSYGRTGTAAEMPDTSESSIQ